jgi:hypothetical protein
MTRGNGGGGAEASELQWLIQHTLPDLLRHLSTTFYPRSSGINLKQTVALSAMLARALHTHTSVTSVVRDVRYPSVFLVYFATMLAYDDCVLPLQTPKADASIRLDALQDEDRLQWLRSTSSNHLSKALEAACSA